MSIGVLEVEIIGEDAHWTAVLRDGHQQCSGVAVLLCWWVDWY